MVMDHQECKKLIEGVIRGKWPKWHINQEACISIHDRFCLYPLEDVEQAIREAHQQKPGPPDEVFAAASALLLARKRVSRVNWIEDRLEEHRQHYAGNRASGLEWPGDEAVREMIRRGEATPMQRYTMRRMAEGRKKLVR
jgi:hypothetical protein